MLQLTLKWFRQKTNKYVSMQRENDQANVGKCQPLENLGKRYIGILCTILAAFQKF